MVIKDKVYWQEYNRKRKEYLQQKNKERYSKDKGCINTTPAEKDTTAQMQPINTTKTDTTFHTTDATRDTTRNNTTTDATEKVVLKKDVTIQPASELIQPTLQPCSNCQQLKEQLDQVATLPQAYINKLLTDKEQQQQKELKLKEIQLEKLRQQLAQQNSNPKPANIPLDANFTSLFYSKDYRKFITHSCFDSCWQGKYCNNCSLLEQQIINWINQKNHYAQEK